jgi:uncharacterized protein YaiL (DUF2058 family)
VDAEPAEACAEDSTSKDMVSEKKKTSDQKSSEAQDSILIGRKKMDNYSEEATLPVTNNKRVKEKTVNSNQHCQLLLGTFRASEDCQSGQREFPV